VQGIGAADLVDRVSPTAHVSLNGGVLLCHRLLNFLAQVEIPTNTFIVGTLEPEHGLGVLEVDHVFEGAALADCVCVVVFQRDGECLQPWELLGQGGGSDDPLPLPFLVFRPRPHSPLKCHCHVVCATSLPRAATVVIAQLYKCRWQVELFFKWIKQNLRIKHFFGTSDNAVKTQVWIAVCVYVLVAIMRKELHLELSLSQILQVVSVNAFEQVPLAELVANVQSPEIIVDSCNQLMLWN
jgi:hypothetical protein